MNASDDDLWRLHVRLRSRRLLIDYLKAMKWSQRRLAAEAGLGHAIVNHLCKGTRSKCSKATAAAIEEALRCPPGLLFTESVSSVSPSNGRRVELPTPAGAR